MKFTVKNPHDDASLVVELPDSALARPPAAGEAFTVKVFAAAPNPAPAPSAAPAGAVAAPRALEARFLGDGQSLLLGTTVVRLPRDFHTGKRGAYRFRFGDVAVPRALNVTPVRPVEPKKTAASLGGGPLKSPMTGKVLAVPAADGAPVKEGDVLVVIEAMKMENRILAECEGHVRGVQVKPGQAVTVGEVLLTVEPKGA